MCEGKLDRRQGGNEFSEKRTNEKTSSSDLSDWLQDALGEYIGTVVDAWKKKIRATKIFPR